MDDTQKELMRTMFDLRGAQYSKCFAPEDGCSEEAIRAHSVQNARALDLLAENGHVIAPVVRSSGTAPPMVDFASVGRNKATTFTGLCAKHDRTIFQSIELNEIDWTSPEHLFLVSYRAVLFEAHASCAAASVVQRMYTKSVDLGRDPGDAPSEAGILATHRLVAAYDMYQYKRAWDSLLLSRDFDAVQHDCLMLEVATPTVAACALFSLDQHIANDDVVRVALNILPVDTTTSVGLLSYLAKDAAIARAELNDVLASTADLQKYNLSKRLVNHCQNFVLAPAYVTSWSGAKLEIVRDFFVRTALKDGLEFDHPDLMLF